MNLVEDEGAILFYFNVFSLKAFEAAGQKGQKSLLLFRYKEIISGIGESFKGLPVLGIHLFDQGTV